MVKLFQKYKFAKGASKSKYMTTLLQRYISELYNTNVTVMYNRSIFEPALEIMVLIT